MSKLKTPYIINKPLIVANFLSLSLFQKNLVSPINAKWLKLYIVKSKTRNILCEASDCKFKDVHMQLISSFKEQVIKKQKK